MTSSSRCPQCGHRLVSTQREKLEEYAFMFPDFICNECGWFPFVEVEEEEEVQA